MSKTRDNVSIPLSGLKLPGILTMVDKPRGLIIFSHGAGSSRLSPRNLYVANVLESAGFATLLFDLLTETEDEIYENRFDIELIASRLVETTSWVMDRAEINDLSVGYFGASTGAAAALKASTQIDRIKAVVSRGGRPDLVLDDLPRVTAPTLLIVGELDDEVIEYNQLAFGALNGIKDLVIIPRATHLFEEPGTLELAAKAAKDWFLSYLAN